MQFLEVQKNGKENLKESEMLKIKKRKKDEDSQRKWGIGKWEKKKKGWC